MALQLQLDLDGEWERIDSVREAVGHAVTATFGDVELRDALAMVTAELLENALKYGDAAQGVHLCIDGDRQNIAVTVESALPDGSPHGEALARRLRWLDEFGDPYVAYTTALGQVFDRQGAAGDSGLGFARIGYEGRCALDCDLSRPGRVRVTARRSFDAAEARAAQARRP